MVLYVIFRFAGEVRRRFEDEMWRYWEGILVSEVLGSDSGVLGLGN